MIIAVIFQSKQLEKRNLKKIRAFPVTSTILVRYEL